MMVDVLKLRARRLALLGELISTIDSLEERARFIAALKSSKAISDLGCDMLAEVYLSAVDHQEAF